jgi:hypothetical protein
MRDANYALNLSQVQQKLVLYFTHGVVGHQEHHGDSFVFDALLSCA